jgi:hypothetical protein
MVDCQMFYRYKTDKVKSLLSKSYINRRNILNKRNVEMDKIELKKFIAEQLNNGIALNDIQKLIVENFKVKMTFLELRILASELDGIEWKKQDPVPPVEEKKPAEAAAVPGKTIVEMSKLARPGVIASGTVVFASGVTAEWMIDQTGRLGLNNVVGQYTDEDIKEFQVELQKVVSRGR